MATRRDPARLPLAWWIPDQACRRPMALALEHPELRMRFGALPDLLRQRKPLLPGRRAGTRLFQALELYRTLGAGPRFRPAWAGWNEDQPVLAVSTSGTSGRPGTVLLSPANLASSARAVNRAVGLGPGDRWLNVLPLQHIAGIAILVRCLQAGATMVLHERFDVNAVWTALRDHAITHISLVPALLARLLEHAGTARAPASLRVVLVGGGHLDEALAARALAHDWPIHVTWGMTETASAVAIRRLDASALPQTHRVGRPLAGLQVRVTDNQARLAIWGPQVTAGRHPARVRRRSRAGVPRRWHLSPDWGTVDPHGEVWVLGRRDRIVISGGVNVPLEAVERTLLTHPAVREVWAMGLPDPVWGERVAALVVGEAEVEALGRWVRERLPAAWRPREIHRLARLPRTPLGKIDAAAARRLVSVPLDGGQ